MAVFTIAQALQLDGMLVLGVPVSIKRPNDAVSPLGVDLSSKPERSESLAV